MSDPDKAEIKLTAKDRNSLYAARGFLASAVEEKLGLRARFDVYFQDPLVARNNPELGFDDNFMVPWEPGFSHGPTSARFAVVDYDADTGHLTPPAVWDPDANVFRGPDGAIVDRHTADTAQFRQVNCWAILQKALNFFEEGFGLGRRISWGFEGNRLIVVPQAGYGKNAYYDRESKSLQFYYFDAQDERVHTCLSADIVAHEFGHAVLDGIRPYFLEAVNPETGAFHEFMGDMTAILFAFRNSTFRKQVADDTNGDISEAKVLSSIARQFGEEVTGKPYLRTGLNTKTMSSVADDPRPHNMSQVLTGALFDIIRKLNEHYLSQTRGDRQTSPSEAFWSTIQRMQRVAIQPLDFLPPVDLTFRDYALAVLRAEQIANPVDPHKYREMMLDAFIAREILNPSDRQDLLQTGYVFDRPTLTVFHDIQTISTSKAEAYRFLDDNRRDFLIPFDQDFIIADLYTVEKRGRQAARLPKQVIIQYLWREDVALEGAQFGAFAGKRTSLPCGGTLAFDESGNLLSWVRKPGSSLPPTRGGALARLAEADRKEGVKRRAGFLDHLARRIADGSIGARLGSEKGLLAARIPPLVARDVDGSLRFELTPHLGISDDSHDTLGGRKWEISS